MLEITDFCPKLRILSILITDFSFQRLAGLMFFMILIVKCIILDFFVLGNIHVNEIVILHLCYIFLIGILLFSLLKNLGKQDISQNAYSKFSD